MHGPCPPKKHPQQNNYMIGGIVTYLHDASNGVVLIGVLFISNVKNHLSRFMEGPNQQYESCEMTEKHIQD